MESRQPQLNRAIQVLGARKAHVQHHPQLAAKTKLTDTTFFINVKVDGFSGIQNLIDSNTKRLVGVTNFDGDVLKSGRDLVIDATRILFTAKGTKVQDADWQNKDVLPAELQNAEIRLSQSADMLVDLPLTDMQAFKFEEWRPLSTTPTLKALETFKLELELPYGVIVPTTKPLFMRIEFRVTQAKK